MDIIIEKFEFSRDEYDAPFWINVADGEGFTVSIGTLRYGCEEAKEIVDLEVFAADLAKAYNDRSRLTRELERERIHVISLRDALRRANGLLDEVEVAFNKFTEEKPAGGLACAVQRFVNKFDTILSKRKAGA